MISACNASEALSNCLQSVLLFTPPDVRLIVLDDASPDSRISEVLTRYSTSPRLEFHRNKGKLGFTRTVNRGIELAGRDDVVLVDAGTEVTPGWLTSIQLACYSSDRVGTATALSNNAGAFSVPRTEEANEIPVWLTLDEYARLIRRTSKRSYPETLSGGDFCLYIRRSCIDSIGAANADFSLSSYGQKNDFYSRTRRKGWQHVVDDATLVGHRIGPTARSEERGDPS